MTKNKNTKLFLAGAMAVSAVVTAGAPVFADTETALPNSDEAAERLAAQYLALTADQRTMLDIVQKNVAANLGMFINSDYKNAEQLKKDLAPLLQPVTGTTKEAIKEDAIKRVSDFRTAAESYLTADGVDVNDLLEMARDMQDELLEDIKTADRNNLEPLIRKAVQSFNEHAPASLKNIVHIPTLEEAAGLIDKIQEEIDAALGGGGVTPMPTPTPTNGVLTVTEDTVENNPQIVLRAIEAAGNLHEIVVTTNSEPAEVTVPFTIINALTAKNEDALLTVRSQTGSISVPVGSFDATEIADELEVTTPELVMQFSIAKDNRQMNNTLGVAATYDVSIGTTEDLFPVSNFGYPIERTIQTATALNPATTVGLHVSEDGTTKAVPTYVDNNTVKMNFSELQAHTLISYSKTFADVNSINNGNYWGKPYIDKLASKMIVNGKTETSFSPSTTITRGEFAAILARGLGLRPADFFGEAGGAFSDVTLDQAVNRDGEIYAVYEAGIIQGYTTGQFGTYDPITRNEAAIMISRAMDFIGEEVDMDESKKAADFNDYRYISNAAREHVERVYQAGYLGGFPDNTYRSQNNATRAEMSKILYNFLESIEFTN